MDKFTTLSGVAAPLPMVNVDTDMIIPKQFLKTIKRTGLGVHLFDELRRTPDGKEIDDFVLNQPLFHDACILIAGANFGCGSSREHAPWALADYGLRAIIAPSFADIFFNNCFQNGMLPIVLPEDVIAELMEEASKGANHTFTIDLPGQRIIRPGGEEIAFEVDPFRKECLLNGLDDIGLTLKRSEKISAFEDNQRAAQPWSAARAPQ
ncbi:MAG: 3-isopropylmalate dehydratase small subunit [Alphaproteobacteria bacterium]|jgi:3-isopropylmalate/(R)-2-methylmalate dehydratase small subunit|nr:3-isopropylmalate dehydratase small subunit [Alphaproteobacteria bacterium]MBT4710953.1 3-isopropylmalate dehydratase small subunit [Alphaproteobacteria bacterium]MBT5859963.1 3-isopropylmalate dehydratase small subunit [Alphaproteobacteria bacterium]